MLCRWQRVLPLFSLPHGKFLPKFESPASFHIVVRLARAEPFNPLAPRALPAEQMMRFRASLRSSPYLLAELPLPQVSGSEAGKFA